ncbi:hypothetical protein F0U44_13270 [Nocardioides humilatus]|uniref:Uncharacterized protein n=1 Tax=Nocardioides humilatus TaxID=2607660 RepID=A0A5B1LHX3_9ACTN|nr:hypothetical protein [Nocardioides humilatus]KAA1419400.1 hypothetical protein F0U44_13270 [Nocardioides humilatus]
MGRRFWIALVTTLIPVTALSALAASPAEAAPAKISASSVNLGAVHMWQTAAKDVTVTLSPGYHVGTATNIPLGSDFHSSLSDSCFDQSSTASIKCVVTESFEPVETNGLGNQTATLRITVCPNGPGACTQYDVAARGSARIPGSLSPNALDFGKHPAGVPTTLSISLKTDPGVFFGDIANLPDLSPANPPSFVVSDVGAGCVQAGATCVVMVTFNGTDIGLRQDSLTVEYCKAVDVCSLVNVPLFGTATAPATVSPTATKFGTKVHVGASVTKTVTVKVLGDWHVESASTTGDLGGNPFTQDWISDCDGNGPQTCTYAATYSPTKIRTSTGTFRVTLCPPGSDWWPFEIECTTVSAGLGGASVAPGTSPTSLKMGTTKAGTRISKTLTVTHDPGWFVYGGTNPDGDFNVGECTSVGNQCALPVNFDPEHIGALSDTITVTLCKPMAGDDLCVELPPVSVTGTGTAPATTRPTSLSFGSVRLTQAKTLVYTVTPDPGWYLDSTTEHTDGPGAYTALFPSCSAGASCPVSVTFAPPHLGTSVGRSIPRVCNEGSGICVRLSEVKLTGKGKP